MPCCSSPAAAKLRPLREGQHDAGEQEVEGREQGGDGQQDEQEEPRAVLHGDPCGCRMALGSVHRSQVAAQVASGQLGWRRPTPHRSEEREHREVGRPRLAGDTLCQHLRLTGARLCARPVEPEVWPPRDSRSHADMSHDSTRCRKGRRSSVDPHRPRSGEPTGQV